MILPFWKQASSRGFHLSAVIGEGFPESRFFFSFLASGIGTSLTRIWAATSYNAWLAQLIQRGQAPGLWLSGQHTNVLFDFLLSGLGSLFGLHARGTDAVSLSILIFFWGAFV